METISIAAKNIKKYGGDNMLINEFSNYLEKYGNGNKQVKIKLDKELLRILQYVNIDDDIYTAIEFFEIKDNDMILISGKRIVKAGD